jgi:hypothetical protein
MVSLEAGKIKLSPENMNKAQKSIPQTIRFIDCFGFKNGLGFSMLRNKSWFSTKLRKLTQVFSITVESLWMI